MSCAFKKKNGNTTHKKRVEVLYLYLPNQIYRAEQNRNMGYIWLLAVLQGL